MKLRKGNWINPEPVPDPPWIYNGDCDDFPSDEEIEDGDDPGPDAYLDEMAWRSERG